MTINVGGYSITEPTNIIVSAPSASQNLYLSNGINYFTSNATTNWTANLTYSATASLNSSLGVGNTTTFVVMVTQGATANYSTATQIDGTAVTAKWQGGTAPYLGNASGVDVYTYTVIKTSATPTWNVFASLVQFK